MAFWLFKSEPESWSWDRQKAAGEAGQEWDGVRNYQARNHMRTMRVGDLGFFYHSGAEKRIVGVVEVIAEAHPDSTDATGTWACVDLRVVQDLPAPVTLAAAKAEPRLKAMALVANSRLSIQPVTADEWAIVREMSV